MSAAACCTRHHSVGEPVPALLRLCSTQRGCVRCMGLLGSCMITALSLHQMSGPSNSACEPPGGGMLATLCCGVGKLWSGLAEARDMAPMVVAMEGAKEASLGAGGTLSVEMPHLLMIGCQEACAACSALPSPALPCPALFCSALLFSALLGSASQSCRVPPDRRIAGEGAAPGLDKCQMLSATGLTHWPVPPQRPFPCPGPVPHRVNDDQAPGCPVAANYRHADAWRQPGSAHASLRSMRQPRDCLQPGAPQRGPSGPNLLPAEDVEARLDTGASMRRSCMTTQQVPALLLSSAWEASAEGLSRLYLLPAEDVEARLDTGARPCGVSARGRSLLKLSLPGLLEAWRMESLGVCSAWPYTSRDWLVASKEGSGTSSVCWAQGAGPRQVLAWQGCQPSSAASSAPCMGCEPCSSTPWLRLPAGRLQRDRVVQRDAVGQRPLLSSAVHSVNVSSRPAEQCGVVRSMARSHTQAQQRQHRRGGGCGGTLAPSRPQTGPRRPSRQPGRWSSPLGRRRSPHPPLAQKGTRQAGAAATQVSFLLLVSSSGHAGGVYMRLFDMA